MRDPNSVPISTTSPSRHQRSGAIAFIVAAVAFVVGGSITITAGPPPSDAPVLGMLSHALWAMAAVLAAVGVQLVVRSSDALRERASSGLSVGALALTAVVGVQWATWAYVDLRAAGQEQYQLLLESILTPFGAGHVLMYAIFFGGGVALLGRSLARSATTGGLLGGIGVAIGGLAVLAAAVSMFLAFGGGHDGHWLFDTATLLLPVGYLWLAVIGIGLLRRA